MSPDEGMTPSLKLSSVRRSPKGLRHVEHDGDGDKTDRPNQRAYRDASPKRGAAHAVDHGRNGATSRGAEYRPRHKD
jgi:hypothetical protein